MSCHWLRGSRINDQLLLSSLRRGALQASVRPGRLARSPVRASTRWRGGRRQGLVSWEKWARDFPHKGLRIWGRQAAFEVGFLLSGLLPPQPRQMLELGRSSTPMHQRASPGCAAPPRRALWSRAELCQALKLGAWGVEPLSDGTRSIIREGFKSSNCSVGGNGTSFPGPASLSCSLARSLALSPPQPSRSLPATAQLRGTAGTTCFKLRSHQRWVLARSSEAS